MEKTRVVVTPYSLGRGLRAGPRKGLTRADLP